MNIKIKLITTIDIFYDKHYLIFKEILSLFFMFSIEKHQFF